MTMLKSTPPSELPHGKVKKHLSYREAWTRIKAAIQQEFFLEAVTIEESIITDRLVSFLIDIHVIERATDDHRYPTFNSLIDLWKKHVASPVTQGSYHNLQDAVDQWRKRRNRVVHGLVKSYPDSEPDDVESFLSEALDTAQEGQKLARAVEQWRKKVRRQQQDRDVH